MLIASVSTVIFNANPLLRYDGYYILSDFLEIPNLRRRARICDGPDQAACFPHQSSAQPLPPPPQRVLAVVLCHRQQHLPHVRRRHHLVVAYKIPVLGVLMAIGGVITWLLVPVFKLSKYLLLEPELHRKRAAIRAMPRGSLNPSTMKAALEPRGRHAAVSRAAHGRAGHVRGMIAKWPPAKARPSPPPWPHRSGRGRAGRCTSSPSTIIWSRATPRRWGRSTNAGPARRARRSRIHAQRAHRSLPPQRRLLHQQGTGRRFPARSDRLGNLRTSTQTAVGMMMQPARAAGCMVPGLFRVIVDEADSLLIDEAVTPLIISNSPDDEANAELYRAADEWRSSWNSAAISPSTGRCAASI
jgi:hypothetical protein